MVAAVRRSAAKTCTHSSYGPSAVSLATQSTKHHRFGTENLSRIKEVVLMELVMRRGVVALGITSVTMSALVMKAGLIVLSHPVS